jgi:hypothetical protein
VWQSVHVNDPFAAVSEWLTVPDVADRLEIPLGKVRRLIEEHHLISVKRDGVQKVPAELIQEGETLPSLPGTILVLLDSGFDLESAKEWLYTPNDALESTPINSLLKGRKSEVRRLAQMLAL